MSIDHFTQVEEGPSAHRDIIEEQDEEEKEMLSTQETSQIGVEETGFHIDMNDPRNDKTIQRLKEMKLKEKKDLYQEQEVPYLKAPSLRHKVFQYRLWNEKLNSRPIPMTEKEVAEDEELVKLIIVQDFEKYMMKMIGHRKRNE